MPIRFPRKLSIATLAVAVAAVVAVVPAVAQATVVAKTEPATNITPTTATLNGTVEFTGSETIAVINYMAEDETLGHLTPLETLKSGSPKKISVNVTELEPNMTYEVQIEAYDKQGQKYSAGEVLHFKTDTFHSLRYESSSYPATITGSQSVANEFTYGELETSVQCKTASLSKSMPEPVQPLDVSAEYNGCETLEISGETLKVPSEINMNGCKYRFELNNGAPPYTARYNVNCSEGKQIEIHIYTSCTIKIPAQQTVGSLEIGTEGELTGRKIHATGTATGVHYTSSKCAIWGAPNEGSDGIFPVNATLEAASGIYITGGTSPEGLFLTGEKSESPASQPHIAAEAYGASISGPDKGVLFTSEPGGAGIIECSSTQLSGGVSEALQTLPLSAAYSGCLAASVFSAEVAMNSCHYALALDNAGPPYTAGYDVACSKEGDTITITVPEIGCTLTIPAQSTSGSLNLAAEGKSSTRKVHASGTATNITYTAKGCGAAGISKGTHSTGLMSVDTTLSATYLG